MESYLAYGENTHTLRLTSELVDLRVGYEKWIRTTSCPSHSISAPYEIENFIRRDIEVVITGLTRKRLTIVTFIYPQTLETLHFFGILSAEISEVGRQFSIKNPNRNLIRRDIEVVITGLTRNQFVRKHTRVRIPLSPPKSLKQTFQALTFYLFSLHFSLDLR